MFIDESINIGKRALFECFVQYTGFCLVLDLEHLYQTHCAPIQYHRGALVFKDQQELETHSRTKTSCELEEGESVERFDNNVYDTRWAEAMEKVFT